jgi:hypothetical protein
MSAPDDKKFNEFKKLVIENSGLSLDEFNRVASEFSAEVRMKFKFWCLYPDSIKTGKLTPPSISEK